ncbi:hypothetical protein BKP37_17825 [Anaerobacillus alkalilacustris]|uniref:Glycosyltransferase 2-like domain-containing protein n=1 Tax=Anaerobacillus alkalilacustris TaxID=393763 RepID=A0A1S2LDS2_9BACI|nr:glycosyltransferase family A protein [Anaerobacillus alkalilacustris]OIJ10400.1 hypothetical protein BKP37_17825 [Anaerobacillus alkalilacustris]
MAKKIVINIMFNNRNVPKGKTKKWIEARIKIFQNFTLRSLKNQTSQDFLCILRFDDQTGGIIKNALNKYPELPENIIFSPDTEANKKINNYIEGSDYFYLVRLDSDDMYHKTYIQQLHDYNPKPSTEVLINKGGYIFDINRSLLKETFRKSPPFYTLIYKTGEYKIGHRKKLVGGHPGAIKFKHEIINKKNYVITIHGHNKSSKFSHRNSNEIWNSRENVDNSLKAKILAEFM